MVKHNCVLYREETWGNYEGQGCKVALLRRAAKYCKNAQAESCFWIRKQYSNVTLDVLLCERSALISICLASDPIRNPAMNEHTEWSAPKGSITHITLLSAGELDKTPLHYVWHWFSRVTPSALLKAVPHAAIVIKKNCQIPRTVGIDMRSISNETATRAQRRMQGHCLRHEACMSWYFSVTWISCSSYVTRMSLFSWYDLTFMFVMYSCRATPT